jgi:hypothetical protein
MSPSKVTSLPEDDAKFISPECTVFFEEGSNNYQLFIAFPSMSIPPAIKI